MGILTVTDFRDEIRGHLANRTDVTDSQITRALNLSQIRMCRKEEFRELQATSSGILTFSNDISTDGVMLIEDMDGLSGESIDDVISLVIHDGSARSNKLIRLTPRQADAKYGNPELYNRTGFPCEYVQWRDRFEFFLIPDQVYLYRLRCHLRPTPLINTGDVSNLENKDDLLVFLTTSYIYGKLGEYQRANDFFSMFQAELENASIDDNKNADLDIKPRHTTAAVGQGVFGEYWNDPFVKRMI